jgi:hypothetical protein
MQDKDSMNNLINQAKSEARSERLRGFFSKHKKIVSNSLIVIATVAVGFFLFAIYQNFQQEKYSEILHQSLIYQQTGDNQKAKESLKKIYESKFAPSGVKSIASLRYAAFLLSEGDKIESAKIYQEISDCRFCDSYIKDVAGLLAVRTWMSDKNEMAKEELSSRIEKMEKKNKILKHYISEQRALLEMHRNNLEKSYQIFDSFSKASDISPDLKNRAVDGLQMIVSKGYEVKMESKPKDAAK